MGRKKENKEIIIARLKPEARDLLAQKLIDMGYVHNRDEVDLPAWSAFLEAIAAGNIVLYKKV